MVLVVMGKSPNRRIGKGLCVKDCLKYDPEDLEKIIKYIKKTRTGYKPIYDVIESLYGSIQY